MTSSIVPSHQYHPPRHPQTISPTTPTTPPPYATGYPSSISTLPRTTSYRSSGPSTISTSSSPSPRLNPGLAAARHVTKAASRLHKRSRINSQKSSDEQLAFDDIVDEGFFSGPGSPPLEPIYPHHSSTPAHRARGKIKPLLKKVSGSSRGNSLDLSRSDGGLPGGVGLGIFDNAGDSSGVDDESPFSNRHRRNFSGASGSSPLLVNAPFAHPKRQVPRRGGYTPEVSHYNTSNESSDDSDDEESITRKTVLQGSKSARDGLHLNTGRSTPMLPTGSMTDLHNRRASGSTLTTPVSPISAVEFPARTFETVITHNPSPTGSRAPSFRKSRVGRSSSETARRVRDPSPTFEASVTAARLAWEAKEEKKEEKRERKRRRSEAKGEERSRATSRCSGRGRGNSGSSNMTNGTVWDEDDLTNAFPEKVPEEDCIEDRQGPGSQSRGRHGTGPKWGLGGRERVRPGFKRRWLGFVVWIRIGMVRMGRRLGF
ncbi:hypothetical protein Q9L58_008652 [Maublancomyces gigas]|uniref:Uncharacterized protein n=1 Tax=Discina gigas TaxID=1032678 RepID=A0ABR3G9H0_9PEZI